MPMSNVGHKSPGDPALGGVICGRVAGAKIIKKNLICLELEKIMWAASWPVFLRKLITAINTYKMLNKGNTKH